MAKGITEQQVFDAADALLLEGARPTIERVRRELGTGSPNTVNRHLETWWRRLAERLREGTAGVDGRPPEVEKAFRALWRLAREQADAEAATRLLVDQRRFSEEADRLAAEKQALDRAREVQGLELRNLQERAAAAQQAAAAADDARKDLERRVAKLNDELQAALRHGEKLGGQVETARERLAGTERHLTGKIAELQGIQEREARRHKAEFERIVKQHKTEQDARRAAERALAKTEADLAARQREAASLTAAQEALTSRLDQQSEQLRELSGGLKTYATPRRRGRKSTKHVR